LTRLRYTKLKYLQKNIAQYYDTPLLVKEKEEIIATLQQEKSYSYIGIIVLAVISLLAIALWFFNDNKRKTYKKRFEALLQKAQTEKTDKKRSRYKDTRIDISEDIITHILSCLDDFEKKKAYLKHNITVASLAKSFNTNTRYLSNTINVYKKKRFSLYITELRIDYAVERLQSDKKLRTYTISAIAGEVGFGNTESFTQAFRKKTGIYPSYFIKELQKQQNS